MVKSDMTVDSAAEFLTHRQFSGSLIKNCLIWMIFGQWSNCRTKSDRIVRTAAEFFTYMQLSGLFLGRRKYLG